jgi:hypothetical protein
LVDAPAIALVVDAAPVAGKASPPRGVDGQL